MSLHFIQKIEVKFDFAIFKFHLDSFEIYSSAPAAHPINISNPDFSYPTFYFYYFRILTLIHSFYLESNQRYGAYFQSYFYDRPMQN